MNNSKIIKQLMPLLAIIMCSVLISGCSPNNNQTSESTNSEVVAEKLIEIVNGEDTSQYTQQEIVLLYEIKEYLYKTFQIPYDEYKEVYNEHFYVGPDPDKSLIFLIYAIGLQDASSIEDYEILEAHNFIGLTVDETRDSIKKMGYTYLDFQEERVKKVYKNGYEISVSDPIQGGSDDESFVYVKKEIKFIDEKDSSEYTQYFITKYNFKNIDGKYKILTQSNNPLHKNLNANLISEEQMKEELAEIDNKFKNVGVDEFTIVFDLKQFCDKYLK